MGTVQPDNIAYIYAHMFHWKASKKSKGLFHEIIIVQVLQMQKVKQ